MVTLITVIHVFVCLFLILVVLLQAGKGGGMGIAFGSSTSSQVFGGRGAGSFLEKMTAGTAIIFMTTSITLAWYASQSDSARLQKMAAAAATKKKADTQKADEDKAQKDAQERAKQLASQPQPPSAAPVAVPASGGAVAPSGGAVAPSGVKTTAPGKGDVKIETKGETKAETKVQVKPAKDEGKAAADKGDKAE